VLLVVTAVVGYSILDSPAALAAASILQGIGVAAISPAGAALVAAGSPPDRIAQGQGLMEAVGFACAALSALPSGLIYGRWGRGVLFGGVAVAGAVLAGLAWRLGRGVPSDSPAE
jgi:hypothetical protein